MRVWFRQIFLFGMVGAIQVIIDSGVLVGLSAAGIGITIANVAGRTSGACVGFLLNGTTTFSNQTEQRLHGRHLARFIATWLTLTLISTVLLYLLRKQASLEIIWVAKPVVEVFLAFVSFFISKFWIYK